MSTSSLATAAEATRPALRVRILGPFEVEGLGQVGSRKARTLLKMLSVTRGQPVSVDRLALGLWGDSPPRQVSKEISVLVSRLRSVLGTGSIVLSDAGYRFLPDWLDLNATFEHAQAASEAMRAGRHRDALAATRAAMALLRGPLLADEPDAEWAEPHRLTTTRLASQISQVGSQAALSLGEPDLAASLAQSQLEHDPYDEVALRVLMTAHAATGRRAVALAAYARFRSRLREELGEEPSRESDAVHTAILKREPPPGGDTPAARLLVLPSLSDLPGRESELEALGEALAATAQGVRLLGFQGEAGIGKSRLLEEWCRVAERAGVTVLRADCQAWHEDHLQPIADALRDHLAGLIPAAAAAILSDEEAGLLELEREPAATPAALLGLLRRLAAGGRVTLVLDDLHLAGPATIDWLRRLERYAAELPVLVVGAWRPAPLALPARFSTRALSPLDLAACSRLVGGEAVHALHARSGGNPRLLLELAAAGSDELPPAVLALAAEQLAALGEAGATLRAAATLGRRIDLEQLVEVLGAAPGELLHHLDRAIGAGLIADSDGELVFRQEAIREALVQGLPVPWRRLLVKRARVRRPRPRTADHHPARHFGAILQTS